MKWKTELKHIFDELKKHDSHLNGFNEELLSEPISIDTFLLKVVKPAFVKLADELKKYDRESFIDNSIDFTISIKIIYKKIEEFNYEIKVRDNGINENTVFSVSSYHIEPGDSKTSGEELISYPSKDIDVISEDNIIHDFLSKYKEHMLKNLKKNHLQ